MDKRQADEANCPTGHEDENDEVFHIPDTFENVMKSVVRARPPGQRPGRPPGACRAGSPRHGSHGDDRR